MEEITKKCKECERELPLSKFRLGRYGRHNDVCMECTRALRRENRQKKINAMNSRGQGSDELFDDKEPNEVLNIMWRAKQWLEHRQYEVQLSASIKIVKHIKFPLR